MPDKTPAQLASDASDAIRQLNHATLSPRDDWHYPSHAYDTVGGLSQAAMMLPQAIEQITRLVADLNEAGHVYSVQGEVEQHLQDTMLGLGEAQVAANQLYGALNRAFSGLSPLAYKD